MSKKKPKPMPAMVLVDWLDAYTHDSGWKSGKTLRKAAPVLVRTVGYIVKDVPRSEDGSEAGYITVAASYVEHDDHFDGDCVIPLGMIVRRVELVTK
jgi:hypothetical protein